MIFTVSFHKQIFDWLTTLTLSQCNVLKSLANYFFLLDVSGAMKLDYPFVRGVAENGILIITLPKLQNFRSILG